MPFFENLLRNYEVFNISGTKKIKIRTIKKFISNINFYMSFVRVAKYKKFKFQLVIWIRTIEHY